MITVVNATALHIPLPDQSVQCVITSPPYWGLRDYGTAKWEGGSEECDHRFRDDKRDSTSTLVGTSNKEGFGLNHYRDTCMKCGATRIDAQIGLESTPAAYVANIVSVMRECWRVLKDDGTCWLNLGDSYAREGGNTAGVPRHWDGREADPGGQHDKRPNAHLIGLKQKDLCGIPWRVAFALQDDGWYLRSDIIWHKPNPMPESVTDRPTKAHEYVFLLTKQARYYYDAEAIKEGDTVYQRKGTKAGHHLTHQDGYKGIAGGILKRDPEEPYGFARDITTVGRNRRSVWTVATSPYSGAHFATFPPALVEPMILAGTSARGECPHCGKAWARVVDRKTAIASGERGTGGTEIARAINGSADRPLHGGDLWYQNANEQITIGWHPACACYAVPPLPEKPEDVNGNMAAYKAEQRRILDLYATLPTVPQLVLDPFAGTATVGRVCAKHGRQFIGTELNLKYIDLADERTSSVQQVML